MVSAIRWGYSAQSETDYPIPKCVVLCTEKLKAVGGWAKTVLKETAGCAAARVGGLRADDRVVAGLPRKRPSPTLEIFRVIYKSSSFARMKKPLPFAVP